MDDSVLFNLSCQQVKTVNRSVITKSQEKSLQIFTSG